MIWLDRTHKTCMAVEDINWMVKDVDPGVTRYNEVMVHYNHPAGVLGSYERELMYEDKNGSCGGRAFCISIGLEANRDKNGWRTGVINSMN